MPLKLPTLASVEHSRSLWRRLKPLLSLEQKQFILDADDHEDYMARLLKAARELGVDVLTAKEILGHASVETTMRYLHKSEANVKLATARLGILTTLHVFQKRRNVHGCNSLHGLVVDFS